MEVWVNSIKLGMIIYGLVALCAGIPYEAIKAIRTNKFNIARTLTSQAFICYMICAFSLTIFPLPTASEAANLTTHTFQYIPFKFVYDIATNRNLFTVLQVVFNVVLTIPFGMFMSYKFKLSGKTTILLTIALTVFIELSQFTGLFFIYKGSYRFCDVDDLMLNTLGGVIGYIVMTKLNKLVPSIEEFEVSMKKRTFGLLVR